MIPEVISYCMGAWRAPIRQTAAVAFVFGLIALRAAPPPQLVAPTPGDRTFSPMPSLRWQPVPEATEYLVQIARDASFADVVVRDRSPIGRYVPASGLAPGDYHWRVAPVTRDGVGVFSEASGFSVVPARNEFRIPSDADAAAIQAIVTKAATQSPARVVFAAGAIYRLKPRAVLLSLAGVSDLEIDGNGATLIFTNATAGLVRLTDCERVTVKNLTVDYDPVPFSVGRVTTVDREKGTFTVVPEPGMQPFDSQLMLDHWTWGVLLDPKVPGKMKTGAPLVIPTLKPALTRTAEGFVQTPASRDMIRHFEPGDKWVQFARQNGGRSLVVAERCRELVFDRITSFAVSGFHYGLLECDDAKVVGCRALVGAGRWFGGNADGVHVRFTEIGPWVEGCTFEGIGDDGVAIYGKGVRVLGKPARNQLHLDGTFFSLRAGSSFLVFDPRSGRPVAENLTVTSVARASATSASPASWFVEFEPGFSETVATDFEDAWQNDQVFNRSLVHHEFMVRRNTFKEVRRYGVILRCADGAIEENRFVNTSDSAITIQNEPRHWRNGLQSENVVVQRNVIEGCNFSTSSIGRGAIHVLLRRIEDRDGRWTDVPTAWRGHRNIVIRDNTITGWQQQAIHLQCVEGGEIAGNTITANRAAVAPSSDQCAIYVDNVARVNVRDNRIEGSRPGTKDIETPRVDGVEGTRASVPASVFPGDDRGGTNPHPN